MAHLVKFEYAEQNQFICGTLNKFWGTRLMLSISWDTKLILKISQHIRNLQELIGSQAMLDIDLRHCKFLIGFFFIIDSCVKVKKFVLLEIEILKTFAAL